MRGLNAMRRNAVPGLALAAAALLTLGADEPTQTIDARGLTFEVPKAWKSSPPASQMRRAQLTVDPKDGDDYPAELIVFAFPGGAGSVEANVQRWRSQFKDDGGNPPKIESKTVRGKNVEVTRVETHGDYKAPQFPGQAPQPDRKNARLLAAIVITDDASYFVRMIGPDKTMNAIAADFDAMIKTIKVGG